MLLHTADATIWVPWAVKSGQVCGLETVSIILCSPQPPGLLWLLGPTTLPHRTNPVASAMAKRRRPADHLDQSRHTFFLSERRGNSTFLPQPSPFPEAD
jgi:hypothetical protein